MNILFLNGIKYKVLMRDIDEKLILLKQLSNLKKCSIYGGQYSVVIDNRIKNFMTLESASELYNENWIERKNKSHE